VLPTVLDRAREHFDAKAALSYDKWCLLYLARHGRVRAAFGLPFEAMTLREVEGWVSELSEMIKAEMTPPKK